MSGSLILGASSYLEGLAGLPAGPASSVALTVFDARLASDTATAVAYSDPAFDGILGAFDQLALQAVVDLVSAALGPVGLTVQIEHSGDGRTWLAKGAAPEVALPAAVSEEGATEMDLGYDDGSLPSLAYVRLCVRLAAAFGPVAGWVTVLVTANDLHEHAFTAKVHTAQAAFNHAGYQCYPAGSTVDMNRVPELGLLAAFVGQPLPPGTEWVVVPGDDTGGGGVRVMPGYELCFDASGRYVVAHAGVIIWQSSENVGEAAIG